MATLRGGSGTGRDETVYRAQLASFVRLATAVTGDEQTAYDAVARLLQPYSG